MGAFNFKIALIVVTAFLAITLFFDFDPRRPSPRAQENLSPATAGPGSQSDSGPQSSRDAKIGKASMFYDDGLGELYNRALLAQELHSDVFGYPMSVLREPVLLEPLSKPAYLLQLVLAEFAKPESERLKWLFWTDADVVLMNPNIPLEAFLPPEPAYSVVHCVASKDQKGLYNGAFFVRIHEWSVRFLSAIVSLTTYEPNVELKHGDQTAMQIVLEKAQFAEHTIYVPQRWFNAPAGNRGKSKEDLFNRPHKVATSTIQEGDLQVRISGSKSRKSQYMRPFLEVSEMHADRWAVPYDRTAYPREIEKFWMDEAPKQMKSDVDISSHGSEQVAGLINDRVRKALARARPRLSHLLR